MDTLRGTTSIVKYGIHDYICTAGVYPVPESRKYYAKTNTIIIIISFTIKNLSIVYKKIIMICYIDINKNSNSFFNISVLYCSIFKTFFTKMTGIQ